MRKALLLPCVLLASLPLSACSMWPPYRAWEQKVKGEGELQRAQSNRQIKILEAKAKLESASAYAQADIVRAQGVARSNQILSNSLGGPEGYLRWKYVEMLESQQSKQIVYIPTEATLPILEAGKR